MITGLIRAPRSGWQASYAYAIGPVEAARPHERAD
jgi:hypothetical protein